MAWGRSRHKFGAKKITLDGYAFGSKLEAAVYKILDDRVKNGEISDLKCQVSVYLTDARILYKPDFSYIENEQVVYCEAKGIETPVWRIKRRLWKHYGLGKLVIYKGSYKYPKISETIIPV